MQRWIVSMWHCYIISNDGPTLWAHAVPMVGGGPEFDFQVLTTKIPGPEKRLVPGVTFVVSMGYENDGKGERAFTNYSVLTRMRETYAETMGLPVRADKPFFGVTP